MNRWNVAGMLLGWMVLLAADVAFAERVVVLEFEGDKGGRVRAQILRELSGEGDIEVLPIAEYKQVAARAGVDPDSAMMPMGVAAVSKELPFSAALEGVVTRKFIFRILDAQGEELFARDVPLNRGRLSPKNAKRIAAALVAGAKSRPKAPEPSPEPMAEEPAQQMPGLDVSSEGRTRVSGATSTEDAHTDVSPAYVDEDMDAERRRPKSPVRPRLVTLHLGGTTTWRAYCSRPGVTSCAQYDGMPDGERPPGGTVDFRPQVPYAGFGLAVDFFPLQSLDNPLNGLGVQAAFSRGFSLTNVRVQTPKGETEPREVISIDDAWHALGTYRFHFGVGRERSPMVGWVGIRGGIAARTFEVEPDAQMQLHGSHRRFPLVGIEAAYPLAQIVRLEVAGTWFFDPKAGADELAGYGSTAKGSGWSVEGGLAGDLWGPLGYELRFRMLPFRDAFSGAGSKWTQTEVGAAEETYTALQWGLTASF